MKFTGKDFINLPLPMPGEYDSLDVIAERANKLMAPWLRAYDVLEELTKGSAEYQCYVMCGCQQDAKDALDEIKVILSESTAASELDSFLESIKKTPLSNPDNI